MEHVILVIHLILAVALVIVVLLQRSEGAGLVGGGSSGMMPVRGAANILTRMTAILATMFFITSLALAVLASQHKPAVSIADQLATESQQQTAPNTAPPATPAPATAPIVPPVSH